MEVQMVLAEVRKHPHGEPNTRHPLQAEGVGGHLHHHMGTPRVRHGAEEGLELEGLRGGALGVERLLPDHILVGADQASLGPQALFQHILEEVRRRCFAVGAGDAHHGHGGGGVAEPVPPQLRQGGAAVGGQHIGNLPLRPRLAENTGRPLLQRHGDKAVSVRLISGNSRKEVPGLGLPGVVADPTNLRLQVRMDLQNLSPAQQFSQFHPMPPALSSFLSFASRRHAPPLEANIPSNGPSGG